MKLIIDGKVFETIPTHCETTSELMDYFHYIKPELSPIQFTRIGDIYRYILPKDVDNIICTEDETIGRDIMCGMVYFVPSTQAIEVATRDIHCVRFSFLSVGYVKYECDDAGNLLNKDAFLDAENVYLDFEADAFDYERALLSDKHITIKNIHEELDLIRHISTQNGAQQLSLFDENVPVDCVPPNDRYAEFTKFLDAFKERDEYGWVIDRQTKLDLCNAVMEYAKAHDWIGCSKYASILDDNNIPYNGDRILKVDASGLDGEVVIAMIEAVYAGSRFCGEGIVDIAFGKGVFYDWLCRLYDLDHMDEYSQMVTTDEFDEEDYSTPPNESEYFYPMVEQLKNGLEKYITTHDVQDLLPFKTQLLKDLDLFGEGKEMEEEYDFDICVRVNEESRYIGFHFETGILEVSCGGSVYDPAVGHDSYTSWLYSLGVDGYEDGSEVDYMSFDEIYTLFADESSRFTIDNPEDYWYDSEAMEEDEEED